MLRSPFVARFARRAAHRRLRRMGGTQSVAWALRIPLVTFLVAAALVMVVRREGRLR